jgi:hypothetical protein
MRGVFALTLLTTLAILLVGDEPAKVAQADVSKLPPAATTVDFQKDIRPLLETRCLACHSRGREKSGLRLDEHAPVLKGGNSGPVIVSGKSAESRLIHLVAGLDDERRMPPKGDALTPKEVGLLRAWVDKGLDWPKDAVLTFKDAAKASHWAFQPVRRPPIPVRPLSGQTWAEAVGWPRNPIDGFILDRLRREGIKNPSPQADRSTLIRRVSLDLLGLPPKPDEVEEFIHDPRPDAYEHLVDRLLASPHYGERWARHWLDSARYADSDGFEKDTGRPFAWRYRHWVIEALNADLPYDQFIIQQLAGDLLADSRMPTVAQADCRIATGFHRNTLTNREGGVDQEQFRVEQLVDRVNTTGKVFLGITIGCAQCHDHKYDPFTQKEYYQLLAFFNSDKEVDLPAPLPGEQVKHDVAKAAFDRKRAELQSAVDSYKKDQLPAAQQKWEAELKLPELRKLPANIQTGLLKEPAARDDKQKKEVADFYSKQDKKLASLTKVLADHDKNAPKLTQAQTLALDSPRKTHVMIRGDFLRPGAEVEAGFPLILGGSSKEKPQTRLELAEWIASPANPLTSRVAVNSTWQKFFGRGLVPTLEDFGTQGEKPSHPELLDWLASEFMEPGVRGQGSGVGGQESNDSRLTTHHSLGMSLKRLHRLIVTSATYRQSSAMRTELASRDPLNVLLARQSRLRLEGEIVRDNALAASGLLVPRIGGPSVRPPQPAGIAELSYAGSVRWVESTGGDRYRRGLYTWFQRTSPYPMLMTFDAPDSNVCCVRRERSNTPLQALTLLNDTVFVECYQALARRIMESPARSASKGVDDQIRHAVHLCLAREPTPAELATLTRLHQELIKAAQAKPDEAAKLLGNQKPANVDPAEAAAWLALARVIMNLDEFVTRE